MWKWLKVAGRTSQDRRRVLGGFAAASGVLASGGAYAAGGNKTGNLRFPGDAVNNHVVYQFNQADPDYQHHVLFSAGALLRKYGDDIKIVISAFGPGIHILLKRPQRPVSKAIHDSVVSLADYGVEFHACGNTLETMNMTAKDILPFAKFVEAGAADLMELQQKGYAYVSW